MEVLKTVVTRWKKLDAILAAIVDALNLRTPKKGNGILLTEGPSGVIIAIDPEALGKTGKESTSTGAGVPDPPSGTAGWKLINVVDQDCNQYTMYVWGTDPQLTTDLTF
jgi:hypothetical protein